MRLAPQDLRGARVYTILRLEFGSEELYYSTHALNITRADGTVIQVRAGLVSQVEWSESVTFDEAPRLGSQPLELVDPSTDFAAQYTAGHDLAATEGELSLWVSGTAWEARRRLLLGLLDAPEYGAKGEPVAFTLKGHVMEDRSLFPPASAVVDEDTWPTAVGDAVGVSYPWVYGKPGTVGTNRYGGSVGIIVHPTNRTLMVAGHRVAATTVEVIKASALPSSQWHGYTISEMTDGRGRTISYVTLEAAGTVGGAPTEAEYDAQETFVCSWGYSGADGGVLNDTQDAAMESAGEIIRDLLRKSTLRMDTGKTAAALSTLQGRRLGFSIAERVNITDYLSDVVAEAVPISMSSGPDGAYPVVWSTDIRARTVHRHLNADLGEIVRVGGFASRSTLHGALASEINVRYAVDVAGQSKRRYLLHGDNTLPATANSGTARPLILSRARYNLADAPSAVEYELRAVWDAATAIASAHDKALMHALPVRTITYICHREDQDLMEGLTVEITDSDVSLAGAFGLITQLSTLDDGETPVVEVTLLPSVG